MPAINFPRVSSGMNTDQLADLVARCLKEVEWLANGNMDSRNIRNIAGYNVGPTDLKHSSGIVGMSGANPTDPNAIRFWSGNANPVIAPFRVNQAGVMTAVGGQFQSAAGYPRVEINSSTNLIAAYQNATNAISIVPNYSSGTPAETFVAGGSVVGYIQDLSPDIAFVTLTGQRGIQISSGITLTLAAASLINMSCSTLRINNNNGVSGTVYVSTTSGGAATTAITFTNGIRTA